MDALDHESVAQPPTKKMLMLLPKGAVQRGSGAAAARNLWLPVSRSVRLAYPQRTAQDEAIAKPASRIEMDKKLQKPACAFTGANGMLGEAPERASAARQHVDVTASVPARGTATFES
ncbi:uncharacterized protein TrAtP1_008513 [Trichoderma atroviride]|uniref:uncharacterized protein n=1 Tax=Hypocrea atroviridis TaxID=63577 RepID=UPI003330B0DE|nr:hypothetical protein TrAtP1_008513 [Trichoderma atroviride]